MVAYEGLGYDSLAAIAGTGEIQENHDALANRCGQWPHRPQFLSSFPGSGLNGEDADTPAGSQNRLSASRQNFPARRNR